MPRINQPRKAPVDQILLSGHDALLTAEAEAVCTHYRRPKSIGARRRNRDAWRHTSSGESNVVVEPSFESCNRVLEAWPNRLRSLYVLLDRQLLKLPWTTGNLAHKPKCIRNESGFPQRRQAKTKQFTDECIAARSCCSFDATNATRITSTNSQSPTITIRATERLDRNSSNRRGQSTGCKRRFVSVG